MLISLYGVPGCLLPCNMEWIISSGAQIPSKLVHVFPFTEFFSQLTLNPGLVPRHRMHCRGFQSRNVMWLQTGTSAECSLQLAKSWPEPLGICICCSGQQQSIPVLWSAEAALDLQLHSSSHTHLKAVLQFLQTLASELVLCHTTHLRIQKHFRRVEEIPIKSCRSLSIFYNYLCCCYRA